MSYKKFSKHPKEYNVYDRVREYLSIPVKVNKVVRTKFDVMEAKKIAIAPISTDVKKNISKEDLLKLIAWIKSENPNARIVIATPIKFNHREFDKVNFFIFGKSSKKSNEFLSLLKECDLFVGVDSGPLHLALCLGKKCIGIFGSNAPETIVDDGFSMLSYRHPVLNGIFCFVRSCQDAKCIHAMFENDISSFVNDNLSIELITEEAICPLSISRDNT